MMARSIELTDDEIKRLRGILTNRWHIYRINGLKEDIDAVVSILEKFGGPVLTLSDEEIKSGSGG